jgi:hypothetical protein
VTAKLSRSRLRRSKSGGDAVTVIVLTRGDLASLLKGRRRDERRSEKSAEAIVVGGRRQAQRMRTREQSAAAKG